MTGKRLALLGLALAAAACAPRQSPPETTPTPGAPGAPGAPAGRQPTGAADARAAVEAFLAAVRAQDLQAMSAIWGTAKGPARDRMERGELEKRELIMQCYLTHDRSRVLNDMPGREGKRVLRVELTNGEQVRQTNFTAVEGPGGRWYVENADLDPVKTFCRQPPGS